MVLAIRLLAGAPVAARRRAAEPWPGCGRGAGDAERLSSQSHAPEAALSSPHGTYLSRSASPGSPGDTRRCRSRPEPRRTPRSGRARSRRGKVPLQSRTKTSALPSSPPASPLGQASRSPPRLPPSTKPVPRLQTLTVVGAVVGVAHAQVAPAVLHAVAAVWALRVDVARRGGHLCQHTEGQPPSDAPQQDGQPAASTPQPRTGPMALWSTLRREGLRPPVPHGKGLSACRASFGAPACRARASFYRPGLGKGTAQGRARDGESISSPRGAHPQGLACVGGSD